MKNQINRMIVVVFALIGFALFIAGCGQKHDPGATCCVCPDGSCTTACCDNMRRGANNTNANNANTNSNANTNNTNTNANTKK